MSTRVFALAVLFLPAVLACRSSAADGAGETVAEVADASLPEVRYYLIADT